MHELTKWWKKFSELDWTTWGDFFYLTIQTQSKKFNVNDEKLWKAAFFKMYWYTFVVRLSKKQCCTLNSAKSFIIKGDFRKIKGNPTFLYGWVRNKLSVFILIKAVYYTVNWQHISSEHSFPTLFWFKCIDIYTVILPVYTFRSLVFQSKMQHR